MVFEAFPVSSLEKIFPESIAGAVPFSHASVLQREVFSFQIVCYADMTGDVTSSGAAMMKCPM